jgi:hypothetical protein
MAGGTYGEILSFGADASEGQQNRPGSHTACQEAPPANVAWRSSRRRLIRLGAVDCFLALTAGHAVAFFHLDIPSFFKTHETRRRLRASAEISGSTFVLSRVER